MGYYTNYELECDPPIDVERFLSMLSVRDHCIKHGVSLPVEAKECFASWAGEFLLSALGNEELVYVLGKGLDGGEGGKWYEHELDMRELSKLAPDILFTLSGRGEEAGDVWKKYFKNGLCQETKVKIVLDEFDESKLK